MQWTNGKFPITRQEMNKIHKGLFDVQTSGHWKENWKEIRDYINPNIGFFDEDTPNQGDRKDQKMIDTTPLLVNNVQAAGMQDGITSPWRPWFKLTANNPGVADDQDTKLWFDVVSQTMVNVMNQSNFYDNSDEYYKELGAPGTAAMITEEDPQHVVHYRNLTIGEYAIGTDSRNYVNRFARLIRMTVAEIVERFGIDNCPGVVKNLWNGKNIEKYLNVKQLVLPNHLATKQGIFWYQMPFLSFYWIDESGNADNYLTIEGYHEFPVAVCRWSTRGADTYGRGPGWYALGDAKELQSIALDASLIRAKMGDPPLLANADLKSSGPINSLPGGVTFYTPNMQTNQPALSTLEPANNPLPALLEQKAELKQTIQQHFYYDLFRMLEGLQQGNITAQEIIQRVQEKMSQLGPVLTRVQHEFLQPVIERTYSICMRNGLFPPAPQILQGQDIKIEYVSVLAQAQKMTGLTSIQQLLAFIGSTAQINPNAIDKINTDEAIDRYAEALGTPTSIINATKECQQQRQQRAQQQQAMQAMQMAQQGAETAKSLGQTPIGQNSALDALIPGAGG